MYIPQAIRDKVKERAYHRCEYCQTAQKISGGQMHVEHIVPLAQGGTSTLDNLCFACV